MPRPDHELDLRDHAAGARRTLTHLLEVLEALRVDLNESSLELGIGAAMTQVLANSPTDGHHRLLVEDRNAGNDALAVTAAGVDVLPRQPGRIGGQIVNAGANPVIVYLCEQSKIAGGGRAAIWLAGNGGSWDFRLSNVLWVGAVSAASPLGSTITVATD